MIIKVTFWDSLNDYIYCPDEVDIDIKEEFYKWIDHTDEIHPFIKYDEVVGMYKDYRGDAIVYWLNKHILKDNQDKSSMIESFSDKKLKYNLLIEL